MELREVSFVAVQPRRTVHEFYAGWNELYDAWMNSTQPEVSVCHMT